MKVIIENLPKLNHLRTEDKQLNISFFYYLLATITNTVNVDIKSLSEVLDDFFHRNGEDTLRRIVFMYAYNEKGLVIVTKFDYLEVALVEGDTSFIYED